MSDDPISFDIALDITDADGDVAESAITVTAANTDTVYSYSDIGESISGGSNDDFIVGGRGDDTLTGGDGDDVFAWSLADADGGTATITDFGTGTDGSDLGNGVNAIDISDLLSNETDSDLTDNLSFSYDQVSNETTIDIVASDGNGGSVTQSIVVEGIDLTGGETDVQTIIDSLINSGQLIID